MKAVLYGYSTSYALYGLSLSYNKHGRSNCAEFHWSEDAINDMKDVAARLLGKGHGHDKFLRMIIVFADILAPLYWWKQMDTYKVGTVCQSESTMHTLLKFPISQSCFEGEIPDATLERMEELRQAKDFDTLNRELPQSWLQRRLWMGNYAVVGEIIRQRSGHKLLEWEVFIDACYRDLLPLYLPKREEVHHG